MAARGNSFQTQRGKAKHHNIVLDLGLEWTYRGKELEGGDGIRP